MFEEKSSLTKLVLKFLLGIVMFLLLIWAANSISPKLNNEILSGLTDLFNSNIFLLIIASLLFLVADVFILLSKPFDLSAPPIKSISAMLLTSFVFKIFSFMNDSIGSGLEKVIEMVSLPVYLIVFFIILILGYLSLFIKYRTESRLLNGLLKTQLKSEEKEKTEEKVQELPKTSKEPRKRKKKQKKK